MTCQQAQMNLSLYLYGELDFAEEEAFEQHVNQCAACARALAREKAWHSSVNSEHVDVPLELLSECRRELKTALSSLELKRSQQLSSLWRWPAMLGFAPSSWSMRLAVASFLVFVGFSAGRWVNWNELGPAPGGGTNQAGLFNPLTSHIRDIEPSDDHRVRIVVDHVSEGQIIGPVDDGEVRQLLLAAIKDPSDPTIQVDSVEILKDQTGNDVRDALLFAAQHDTNAGVRLKAVEGLQRFVGDPAAREGLVSAVEHDSDPDVRSQAINVLVPVTSSVQYSPELIGALQQIMQSDPDDDYIRTRCMELLHEMKASFEVY